MLLSGLDLNHKLGSKWVWLAFWLNGLGSLGGVLTLFLAVCLIHRPGFLCLYGGSGNILD